MEEMIKYDENDIQVLEGLEAVRKRPGMYIGTTSSRGLHHLVWEIVDNAIDEALAGYCNQIEVIINNDNSVTVKDNGRGIPTGIHPKTGLSSVETVYTILHAGGKFGGNGYKVSGGLHGVGASVVNALSKWVDINVYQNGKIYYIRFEDGGKAVSKLTIVGECPIERTGTTVTFKPDPQIFQETIEFEYDILRTRIRELSYLNRGLKIILIDDRDETKKEDLLKRDWIRRAVKFSKNYFDSDILKMTNCLKDCYNLHKWCTISNNLKYVDFSKELQKKTFVDVGTLAGAACAGGTCEVNF